MSERMCMSRKENQQNSTKESTNCHHKKTTGVGESYQFIWRSVGLGRRKEGQGLKGTDDKEERDVVNKEAK